MGAVLRSRVYGREVHGADVARGWPAMLAPGIIAVMGAEAADELLRTGREALAAADWETARSCFEKARELGDSADVLDGLSQALHFQGEYDRAIDLKERAFAAYRRLGRPVKAAELARWLAFLHGAVHGNMAAANGWMARAARVLEGSEECAAHGWLILDRAPFSRDASERERLATAALAIARRYGDLNLEFDALALLGETYVSSGRVAEGMTFIDEAMAAVAGEGHCGPDALLDGGLRAFHGRYVRRRQAVSADGRGFVRGAQ